MSYREIFIPGADGSRVSAVQIGPLVYAPRLLPLTEPGAGLDAQLESVLGRVRSVIGEAGGGTGDLARVTLFMRSVKDRRVLNEVWRRWFPDPARRPPHKYIPADVPGGYEVMADAVAVLDGGRRILRPQRRNRRNRMWDHAKVQLTLLALGVRSGLLLFRSRTRQAGDIQLAQTYSVARVEYH